jgi:hypothetical protein
MDIEISCKSFECEKGYNGFIDLKLREIDFGSNDEDTYKKFLERWYGATEVSEVFKVNEIVGAYDESELLESIDNDIIAEWTNDKITVDNIEEFIDDEVLARYVRERRIDSVVNK